MQGEQGVVAHVKLPTADEQADYDTLELDFTLSCPGQCLRCNEPLSIMNMLLADCMQWAC